MNDLAKELETIRAEMEMIDAKKGPVTDDDNERYGILLDAERELLDMMKACDPVDEFEYCDKASPIHY